MKLVFNKSTIALVLIFFAISLFCKLGFPTTPQLAKQRMSGLLGGVRDSAASQNSAEIEGLAKFAVDEHNKKENALLEFARVVKAKEQVVAGTMHHLTLEVIDAGAKKIYEAKVWVKPWENFKKLEEFKRADGNEPEWQTVPTHDPAVKEAANHAVKTLQQRSNSLAPYELLEIVLAKSKKTEDATKFDVLLKLKRGSKEEKINVEVHQNNEGTFNLKQMEQDHS